MTPIRYPLAWACTRVGWGLLASVVVVALLAVLVGTGRNWRERAASVGGM